MRQVKPGTLYTSPFSMAYWRDAAAELRDKMTELKKKLQEMDEE